MRWIGDNLDVIGGHLVSHLLLAVPPIVASFLLALPVGWLAGRVRWLRAPLLSAAGLLYAIPSLPLFVVLPLVIGTGVRDATNIIVALTLYGLALMVPATADALRSVDPRVVDAADALGYGGVRRFLTVELPVAGPTLLAGLRVVAVSTISLVTVGAVLGVPSLGMLFTDGFQRNIMPSILAGIVLTIALALVVDALLVALGRLVLPWTRPAAAAVVAPTQAEVAP
ncbi:ABC transporter permease [Propioniciclava soli]|uniref:ABC transporter permease n=1 Tax=Propioniciclava soli TaxID=2775081 RepID=A0ABZ3C5U5_9ACTN|nr:ABC transporter permease [Propioniciclava soli]